MVQKNTLPEVLTPAWIEDLQKTLYESTKNGPNALKKVVSKSFALNLVERTEAVLAGEPPLLQVSLKFMYQFHVLITFFGGIFRIGIGVLLYCLLLSSANAYRSF